MVGATTMTQFQIDEATIPSTLDAADAADFRAAIEVVGDVVTGIIGNREFVWSAAEELPEWQNPLEPKRLWVARVDGTVAALAMYRPLPTEGTRTAEMEIDVLAAYRRRGIGSALLEVLVSAAANDARTVLQTWALNPVPTGPCTVLPDRLRHGAGGFGCHAVPARPRVPPRAGAANQPSGLACRRSGPGCAARRGGCRGGFRVPPVALGRRDTAGMAGRHGDAAAEDEHGCPGRRDGCRGG